jgi:hypothetical protein
MFYAERISSSKTMDIWFFSLDLKVGATTMDKLKNKFTNEQNFCLKLQLFFDYSKTWLFFSALF